MPCPRVQPRSLRPQARANARLTQGIPCCRMPPTVKKANIYAPLVKAAIADLKDRTGSSLLAIKKWIVAKDATATNDTAIKAALKRAVATGELVKIKASFKLSDSGKAAMKPAKKAKKAAKPKAKATKAKSTKPKVAKKVIKAKKPAAKKASKAAKKPAAAKKVAAPKKTIAKKPAVAKKAAAPKKAIAKKVSKPAKK